MDNRAYQVLGLLWEKVFGLTLCIMGEDTLKNIAIPLCTQNYDIFTPQAVLMNPFSSLNFTAFALRLTIGSKERWEPFLSGPRYGGNRFHRTSPPAHRRVSLI